MAGFQAGIRETFRVKTLVLLGCAVIGYMAAKLLYQHVFSKVAVLARTPEVADLTVMVLAAGFVSGANAIAMVIGAGVSLVNNIGTRTGIAWLQVGR